MWIASLAFFHDLSQDLFSNWEAFKHVLREWLGPGPKNWYLTKDHQITHIPVPDSLVFCPTKLRISSVSEQESDERGKRLPWLSLYVKGPGLEWDLTEWMSQIRTLSDLSLLSFVRLAGRVHHIYIPEIREVEVHVQDRQGDEHVYEFEGDVQLRLQSTAISQ